MSQLELFSEYLLEILDKHVGKVANLNASRNLWTKRKIHAHVRDIGDVATVDLVYKVKNEGMK